jgi:hypothetical protein
VRKLLIRPRPSHARINVRFYRAPAADVKSDRLLGSENEIQMRLCQAGACIAALNKQDDMGIHI